jgi:hypothetical protein
MNDDDDDDDDDDDVDDDDNIALPSPLLSSTTATAMPMMPLLAADSTSAISAAPRSMPPTAGAAALGLHSSNSECNSEGQVHYKSSSLDKSALTACRKACPTHQAANPASHMHA